MEDQKTSSSDPVAQSWTRRYPPITVALVSAVLIALIVLPSALNIPQTNPTTIAEYAPVPPQDDAPPDTPGNVSAFGLGTSSSLRRGGAPVPADGGHPPVGERKINKRCVGKPARQAEDPMSPPCVPFFEGNNGGSTYPGVTSDEVTVVLYSDTGNRNTGDRFENSPAGGTFCDVDLPPNTGGAGCISPDTNQDFGWVKFARTFSRHFNSRYQTYDRHVHYWVYWVRGGGTAQKRADASEIYDRFHPFAVLDNTPGTGNDDAFFDAVTRRRTMVIPSSGLSPPQLGANYQKLAPYSWTFIPDAEHWMQSYTSYVCNRVVPFPVDHAQGGIAKDGSAMEGDPRRLGLMYSSFTGNPQYQFAASIVRDAVPGCGGKLWADVGYDLGPDDGRESAKVVTQMKDADVTTIFSIGIDPTVLGNAFDAARYYPELVFAGDGFMDRNLTGRLMPQNWMRNAWIMAYLTGSLSLDEDYGYRACVEGDSNLTRASCQSAANYYRDHYMLFKMIQAAGPRLTPSAVDRGMHALPKVSSTNFTEASCYFDPSDYTCVKDAMEQWWDGAGRVPGASSPGCWRMVSGGKRYLADSWPKSDDVFDNGTNDPCNAFTLGGPVDP